MNTVMLKIAAVWLVIIVGGTVWTVIQSGKNDKECFEACEALGKEVVVKKPDVNSLSFNALTKCRCTE